MDYLKTGKAGLFWSSVTLVGKNRGIRGAHYAAKNTMYEDFLRTISFCLELANRPRQNTEAEASFQNAHWLFWWEKR